MKTKSGYPFYGPNTGILVFNGIAPRLPGDPGHSDTFSYPVCYQVVEGSFSKLFDQDKQTKQNVIEGVKKLKSLGIKAVVGDCGLMSIYQAEMAQIGMSVVASSLCLIPTIWQICGKKGKIGIITGHSRMLSQECFVQNGCADIPIVIKGMESEPYFNEVVINNGTMLDPEKMTADVINAGKKLIESNPDISAIVLECSNLATYAKPLYETLEIPVYDIIAAANLVTYSINPTNFLKSSMV